MVGQCLSYARVLACERAYPAELAARGCKTLGELPWVCRQMNLGSRLKND